MCFDDLDDYSAPPMPGSADYYSPAAYEYNDYYDSDSTHHDYAYDIDEEYLAAVMDGSNVYD